MWFNLILVFVASLIYYVYRFLTKFDYWKNRNVTGPEPKAIFGNIKDTFMRKKHIGINIVDIYKEFPKEKVVGLYRMTTPCLLARDLDVIKHIMIKDFDNFTDRGLEFDTDGIGQNLFHADGDTWNVLRHKFTPIFTSGKLKNMFYLIIERGNLFSDYLQKTVKETPEFNMHLLISKFTTASIAACAFGLDIDYDDDIMKKLQDINEKMLFVNHFMELDFMFPGVLKHLSASLLPKFIKQFFNDLVDTVVQQRDGKPSDRKDFMDLMLELREQKNVQGMKRNKEETMNVEITNNLLAAQAFVFYAGGFETSASTMTFMLYHLALNPDIQDRVIAEIDEVLTQNNGEVTYDCITDLKYMSNVFDETLRLYPIVEPLMRKCKNDYKIPGTDVTIEKNTMVLITPMGIQRDEKHFPEPEKFDPDRFTTENSKNWHPCAYLPFGLGPRNCIGMRFAKVQSRVCIVKLLSKFRVEPTERTMKKMVFDPHKIVINPLGAVYLKLVPRTK